MAIDKPACWESFGKFAEIANGNVCFFWAGFVAV
jgi:hypothetical protein